MQNYDDFVTAIRDRGYFADVRRHDDSTSDVQCSSLRGGGSSFWMERRSAGDWCIGTWGGRVYELPEGADPVAVAVDCLEHQQDRTFAALDELFVETLRLKVGIHPTAVEVEMTEAETREFLGLIAEAQDGSSLKPALQALWLKRVGVDVDERLVSAAVATLGQVLTSDDRLLEDKRDALYLLGLLRRVAQAAVPQILSLVQHEDLQVCVAIALGFLAPTDAAVVSRLSETASTSESPEFRGKVMRTLGHPDGPQAAVDTLVRGLADPSDDVRRFALCSLMRMERFPPTAFETIEQLCSSEDREVQANALICLCGYGSRAQPTLLRFLSHSSPTLRARAARALGLISPNATEAIPELERLAARGGWVGQVATEAISRIR